MPDQTPTYDLMLLLSMSADDSRRAKIIGDVESTISSGGGSIVHNGDWGTRPLAFRIQHQGEAEYHLLQFTGPTTLIESLNHSLGITDGVLRHRIIKVLPGTPPPPTPAPVAVGAAASSGRAGASDAAASVAEPSDAATSDAEPGPSAAATAPTEEPDAGAGDEPAEAAPEPAEAAPESAEAAPESAEATPEDAEAEPGADE